MDLSSFEIYKGKNFGQLCKDIVTNQNQKHDQLDVLINELREFVKTANDAIVIIPLIRDYFDIGVKNDEQLVKLAAVIQRIISRGNEGDNDSPLMLTDEERKQLMSEVESINKTTSEPYVDKKQEK
jgi:hypothetical protein